MGWPWLVGVVFLRLWHGGLGCSVVFLRLWHGGHGHSVVFFVAVAWWPWPRCGAFAAMVWWPWLWCGVFAAVAWWPWPQCGVFAAVEWWPWPWCTKMLFQTTHLQPNQKHFYILHAIRSAMHDALVQWQWDHKHGHQDASAIVSSDKAR